MAFTSHRRICNFHILPPQLSDLICDTWPLLEMNLHSAFMQELVSNEYVISKCTALLAMQVKITP